MNMAKITMVEAVTNALDYEMSRDKSVVVLGEDVGVDGGVFRATDGLIKKYGSDRVIDTPLAESGIVGASIGMAINGLRPVAEIQFMGFTYPAVDQLISHASRMRNRSRGVFTCPIVVRAPYGIGVKALEHHSESTEAYFIHTPGLKVVVPSSPSDCKGLLISAIRDPDPVIFLEPTRLYRSVKEEVPSGEHIVPLGKAKIVQEGMDCTIVSWGAMLHECMKAAELLQKDEIFPEIIDLRTLSPMDTEAILSSVKKTGRCVVVQEAPRTLGLSSEISALIMEKALEHLQAPVQRVTSFDIIPPLQRGEQHYPPDPYRIYRSVKKVVEM